MFQFFVLKFCCGLCKFVRCSSVNLCVMVWKLGKKVTILILIEFFNLCNIKQNNVQHLRFCVAQSLMYKG